MADTIFALATPPGKGGLAVIRVSGPQAFASMRAVSGFDSIVPRRAVYCTFSDPCSKDVIDHGVVVAFKGPHSFTGEDTAEYSLHGGMVIVRQMLDVLAAQDAHRLALPGEFTRRAFESGKLDLTEAEAVADLIDAQTALQKSQALVQLGGGLSDLYNSWTAELKKALAHLEADLEFPDEDLPEGIAPQVIPALASLAGQIAAHLDDNRRGERLRDGIHIAVIGAPNAGKSSLVNALAQRDIAIVSAQAGTTRDIIEAHLDLGGYPVILSDTAGLRPELLGGQSGHDGHDAIESEGIKRALARARQADIKLLLYDASALPALDEHTCALEDEAALRVFNKIDCGDKDKASSEIGDAICVSAQTGEGMPALIIALTKRIESLVGTSETPTLTRRRHRAALQECKDALERSMRARLPELMAEDVRLAIRHLGHITGRVDVEELLDVIFKDFCIGK